MAPHLPCGDLRFVFEDNEVILDFHSVYKPQQYLVVPTREHLVLYSPNISIEQYWKDSQSVPRQHHFPCRREVGVQGSSCGIRSLGSHVPYASSRLPQR